MEFTNSSRLRSLYGMLRLRPNRSEYEFTANIAYLSAYGCTPALNRVKHILTEVLLSILPPSEALFEFLYSLSLRLRPTTSLSQLVCNFATTAKRSDLHDLAHMPDNGPCPCHHGPYASYMDHGLGHVFTMDLSILSHDSPLLASSPPGNFRVAPPVVRTDRRIAFHELWSQVIDLMEAAQCYEAILSEDASFTLFMDSVGRQLPDKSCMPNPRYASTPLTESLALTNQHLMVTCIDKVPNHLAVVCIHWAAKQVIDHLDSPCYCIVSQDEVSYYKMTLYGLLDRLGLDPYIPDTAPYVYPTVKVHKCPDHDPTVPHECSIAARKITADVSSFLTWLGRLTSAILSPVKLAIMDHRHALEQSFEAQHGYRLRFLYWITAWQTVPLNLPSTVLASLRLINCDVKQCFDNIPQEGRDGLLEVIAHPIMEAFDFTQKLIFIPMDADDYPISNRAVFANSQPWTPPNGTIVRWICITRPLALEVARLYLTSLFVMVGPTLARQVLGIPMGGSPSSHFLDLYLDHYEYRWAQSVAALAVSHPARAYRLAMAMLYFFRYADDTMGIVPPWFISLMEPTAERDPASASWIYPLLHSDGSTILEFEIEGALTCSITFLCLTITLGSSKRPRHGAAALRSVSYTPYSKATKFQFGVHRLTHWRSFTMPSVKFSAFKTLMTYAILGSTTADGAIEYLCRVCDTLRDNSYPTRIILRMWDDAVQSHLYSTPCRLALSAHLPAIATAVRGFITGS